MSVDRYMHGCATFKLGEKRFALAGGGYSINEGGMASVEILDLSSLESQWLQGPDMPRELMESRFLTNPTKDGVLAVAGISGSDYQNAIFSMTCPDGTLASCQWKVLDQTMNISRKDHAAVLVSDSVVSCA